MSIDLSQNRDPADLIDAIWEARRADRRELLPQILDLLEHEAPMVREEALSLAFVKWNEVSPRVRLEIIIRDDSDPGVRARGLGALALTSKPSTRSRDIDTLRGFVLDGYQEEQVRKAAYEGLVLLAQGRTAAIDDSTDLDEDIDTDWVRSL